MSISKLKIILLSFIFILMLGCLKQQSNMSDINNSTNYLLFHRGPSVVVDYVSAVKSFYSSKLNPFKMKYNVRPEVNVEFISKNDTVLTDMENVSSELDPNSTFIYSYSAHGGTDGTWSAEMHPCKDQCMQASWLVERMKKGRTKDGKVVPFKRFILIGDSCHSEKFMLRFQESIEKEPDKLFEEGIYIASSYADLVSYNYVDWHIILPILSFLRAQQLSSCKNESNSYQSTYSTKIEPFLKNNSLNSNPIQAVLKTLSLEELVKSKNFNEKNPTFNDIEFIFQQLRDNSDEILKKLFTPRQMRQNIVKIAFNISFSNDSLRNESIFPPIDNCN